MPSGCAAPLCASPCSHRPSGANMCFPLQLGAISGGKDKAVRLPPEVFSSHLERTYLVIHSWGRRGQLEARPAVFKENVTLRPIGVTLGCAYRRLGVSGRARFCPRKPVGPNSYVCQWFGPLGKCAYVCRRACVCALTPTDQILAVLTLLMNCSATAVIIPSLWSKSVGIIQ